MLPEEFKFASSAIERYMLKEKECVELRGLLDMLRGSAHKLAIQTTFTKGLVELPDFLHMPVQEHMMKIFELKLKQAQEALLAIPLVPPAVSPPPRPLTTEERIAIATERDISAKNSMSQYANERIDH